MTAGTRRRTRGAASGAMIAALIVASTVLSVAPASAAAPQAALVRSAATAAVCDPNRVSSISQDGVLRQITLDASANVASRTRLGSWTLSSGATANALGVSRDGTRHAAVESGTTSAGTTEVRALLIHDSSTGRTQRVSAAAFVPDPARYPGITFTAGAYDAAGRYAFGGYTKPAEGTARFVLFRVADPADGGQVEVVGSFDTGARDVEDGDMAFDAAGNLIVLQQRTANGATVLTTGLVDAAALDGPDPGAELPLAWTGSRPVSLASGDKITGAAYAADGLLAVGTEKSLQTLDPTSLEAVGTKADIAAWSIFRLFVSEKSADLASCVTPPTLRIGIDTGSGAAPSDQFGLGLWRDAAHEDEVMTVTTSVGGAGARSGAIPVRQAASFWFAEHATAGSLDDFASVWRCVRTDTGAEIARVAASAGTVAIPAAAGVAVECTVRTTSLIVDVEVSAHLADGNEANPSARPGTAVRLIAEPTVGTIVPVAATEGTAAVEEQRIADDGTARWRFRLGGEDARAALRIAQTPLSGDEFSSGSCTITSADGVTSELRLDDASPATIEDVRPGDAVRCGYRNAPRPTTLTLRAEISHGIAEHAGKFWLWTWSERTDGAAGPAGETGSSAVTDVAVEPGRYTLRDQGVGAEARVYAPSAAGDWRCVDQRGASVALDGVAANTVEIARGDQLVCTVTKSAAALVLLERLENATEATPARVLTATPAASPTGGLPTVQASASAAASAANTFLVLPGHEYTLSAAAEPGAAASAFRTIGIELLVDAERPEDAASWQLVDDPAKPIVLEAGTRAVYRIVTAPITPLTLPFTGGTGADLFTIAGAMLLLVPLVVMLRRVVGACRTRARGIPWATALRPPRR